MLWEKLKGSYKILTVRDSEYLQWRYLNHPLENNCLVSIRDKNSDLVGYLAYIIRKRSNSSLLIFEVLDIFCDHKNLHLIHSILDWIIHKAKREEADIIKISFLHRSIKNILKKYGFYKFAIPNTDMIIFKNNSEYSNSFIQDGNNWYLCSADGDAILGIES